MTQEVEKSGVEGWIADKSAQILYDIVTQVPSSNLQASPRAKQLSEERIRKACMTASLASGTMSLPGGLLGMATILPDLANIWRIQSQLVVDIAALHGKLAMVRREDMIWCLFRHATVQVAKDFAVRLGQRIIVQQLTSKAVQTLLRKIGIKSLERVTGKTIVRAVPILGMAASATYAWYDTRGVGRAALELFTDPEPLQYS